MNILPESIDATLMAESGLKVDGATADTREQLITVYKERLGG